MFDNGPQPVRRPGCILALPVGTDAEPGVVVDCPKQQLRRLQAICQFRDIVTNLIRDRNGTHAVASLDLSLAKIGSDAILPESDVIFDQVGWEKIHF